MTIVCGTDLSKPAHSASVIAARLSCRLDQELLLVHAVVPQPVDPIGIDFEPVRAAMAERLEHEAAELRKLGSKVTARAVIGWPEEEITRAASEADADLIVIGAVGHRRAAEWLIGRVAERVALTTSVPLLLVRDPKPLQSWIAGTEPLRVLLATDCSPVSDFALDWLARLKDVGRCDVVMTYVANPLAESARLNIAGPISDLALHPIVSEVVERELARRTKLIALGGRVWPSVKLTLGDAGSELVKAAAEEKAGLVVVGSHQRRLIGRVLHGAVSLDVVRGSNTNVVCVPFHTADEQFRALDAPPIHTILAATDFSPCGNRAVAWAMSIAPPAAKVVLLHVAKGREDYEKASAELAQIEHPRSWPDNVAIELVVQSNGDVAKTIWSQAQRSGADVIVVGAHGESGVRALMGSVAQDLLALSTKPVLVVRDEAAS